MKKNDYFFQIKKRNSGVTVLIAGSECSIRSISSNEIKCSTGSYSNSSIKALIEVFINWLNSKLLIRIIIPKISKNLSCQTKLYVKLILWLDY